MDFVALVHECAPWASPQTMASIVRKESGFNPLVIGVNGGARLVRQPANKAEAVATASYLIASGYNIDLGLAQINSANLRKLNLSVDAAFDSCRNISAAATLLSLNFQTAKARIVGEQPALLAAISSYNTGSMRAGFANGYVRDVVANAGQVIPVAFLPPAIRVTTSKHNKIASIASSRTPAMNVTYYLDDTGALKQIEN